MAVGGGGFVSTPTSPLNAYVLGRAGKPRPRVCFVPTAGADNLAFVAAFYRACAALDCEPSDLPLFNRTGEDVREKLLAQDVIWVGGGNTANLLAIWRTHGVDAAMREAWEAGVVLSGSSAGMICWFEASITDSFGPQLDPLDDGLGFLPAAPARTTTARTGAGPCTARRSRPVSRAATRPTTRWRCASTARSSPSA